MKPEILLQLQKANTLGELLDTIKKNYDIENCKLMPLTKATVINGLSIAVKMTNCKQRVKK